MHVGMRLHQGQTMPRDVLTVVREICLSLPQAEEFLSHATPNFRVRGRSFATYVINHHGDGRIALWLRAPPGAQALYTQAEPTHFFIPPYVGPSGWLGVHLNQGIKWQRVAELTREAYEQVAPKALVAEIGPAAQIKPPTIAPTAADVDPLKSKRGQILIKGMRKVCLALPEVSEDTQFGNPVWRAGKRVFAMLYHADKKLIASFWVGVDQQSIYTMDERFFVPPYMGHNGWIAIDVTRTSNWQEIGALASASYRHFALKRMLNALHE